jgi:uracil-DNA glycosylase
MKLSAAELSRYKHLAADLPGLDRPVYAAAGRDPLAPVLGSASTNAPLCVFGRDPGREEVAAGKPFVGAAGRILRSALAPFARKSHEPPDNRYDEDDLPVFWLGTVPYKRVANKAWPAHVIRAFQPAVRDMLLEHWKGSRVLTLGTHAYDWFMLGQSAEDSQRMTDFWASEDRYRGAVRVRVANDRQERWLTLYPLPHPSPANAVWHKRFPPLLDQRLRTILGPEQG